LDSLKSKLNKKANISGIIRYCNDKIRKLISIS